MNTLLVILINIVTQDANNMQYDMNINYESENVQNQQCIQLVYTYFMHFKYFKCIKLARSLLHLIGQIIYNIYCKWDPTTINDL